MLRVPGSSKDLLTVKANGGGVRIIYSPLGAPMVSSEGACAAYYLYGRYQ
jgi:hydrogenase expression/formation protein HypD